MAKLPMRKLALLGLLLAGVPAFAGRPVAVTSYPPEWPHRAPWKLNRELLLPETERIVFVVDRPRGAPPSVAALDHLVSLASKYGGRPASFVQLGDPGAPDVRWVDPPAPPQLARTGARFRDGDPLSDSQVSRDDVDTARYCNEVPACPSGALAASVSFVFVRYLGYVGSGFGSSSTVVSDASCGGREFSVIRVAQTWIARKRAPGIGQGFLEERALAHEYGHSLGLGSNPGHGWWYSRVPYRGAAHCVHTECAVAVGTAKALLKGQMLDYCEACLRDIEQAREHWRTGAEFPEAPRLPQPDPAAHVARLKTYNFREGGEAEKLVGYGKAVMPSLVARLREMPGGSAASPRSCAVRLALKIVVAEDDLRRPPGTPDLAIPDPAEDYSAAFQSWWQQESERFMGGDDWSLPPILLMPESK